MSEFTVTASTAREATTIARAQVGPKPMITVSRILGTIDLWTVQSV